MFAFDAETVTVTELAAALDAGEVTSRELVQAHLERIVALDGAFRAVRCVAPDALDQADASDAVRRAGTSRSLLEGIPVLIKDNIDVAGLPTTAGALALEHSVPDRDAHLVSRLRSAGAVILGKTNLSELANFLTEDMPSGYSSLGGQVLNPYDTALTPSGSSSGSAVAVALGLAPVAVGTETDGSIISPSEHQSLVGLKPTVGLVSRTGILPISVSQDTAGPMARTVADAAILLAAMAGPDPADRATASAPARADPGAGGDRPGVGILAGARLGVVRRPGVPGSGPGSQAAAARREIRAGSADRPGRAARHDAALDALRDAGADLVDVVLPEADPTDEISVLHHEFAPGVDRYLAALGPDAPLRTLAALREWNLEHATEALKFGQVHVDVAVAIDQATTQDAADGTRARDHRIATDALTDALGPDLDALVFPSAEGCGWAARAGWPSVVVPAGYSANDRRPVGVMFVSRPWSESRLLGLAAAFEQVTGWRRPPSEVNPAVFRSR